MARGNGEGCTSTQAQPRGAATSELPGRAEMEAVAPLLHSWVNGEDRPDWTVAFAPYAATLARLVPAKPLLLYRHERIGEAAAAQWERPTAWSTCRAAAEDYAGTASRRLVCALVDPSEMICSIPLAQAHADRAEVEFRGGERIDWIGQEEIVVRAHPSLRARRVLREPVAPGPARVVSPRKPVLAA